MIEVRIDMIGGAWTSLPRTLKRPWIACNRMREEGGFWHGDERGRVQELLNSLKFSPEYVDIELSSPYLKHVVEKVKSSGRKVLVSYHNFRCTPHLDELKRVLEMEAEAGADVCKIVTLAKSFEDNITVLKLLRHEAKVPTVAFCMGEAGLASRILSPLFGGAFTYASIEEGLESAAGQVDLERLQEFYRIFYEALEGMVNARQK